MTTTPADIFSANLETPQVSAVVDLPTLSPEAIDARPFPVSDGYTTVHAVRSGLGFPVVVWSNKLNGRRRFETLYRRTRAGEFFGESIDAERRPAILTVLNRLEWQAGRDCLRSAVWLPATSILPA